MSAPASYDETIAQNHETDVSNSENEAKEFGLLKLLSLPLFLLG